jgi:hypothetical protein
VALELDQLPRLRSWLEQGPPAAHLWHFTSPQGLKGIAATAEVWATSAAWLNDAAESRIAFELARDLLLAVHQQRQGTQDAEQDFLAVALEQLGSQRPDPRICTTSFTEQTAFDPDIYGVVSPAGATTMDRLTQWQAYCPPDGGFALGVPGPHLREVAKDQGFILARCIYSREKAANLIAEVIAHHVDAAGETPAVNEWVTRLLTDLRLIAPIVKHPSFAHEKEWRVIKQLYEYDPDVRVRASDTTLIPYLGFRLVTDAHPTIEGPDSYGDSLGVFVGPRSDYRMTPDASEAQADASYAAQILFHTSRPNLGWTSRSLVPYRARL